MTNDTQENDHSVCSLLDHFKLHHGQLPISQMSEKTTPEISLPLDTNFLRQFLMKSVVRFSKKSVETEEEFQLVRDWVQWDFQEVLQEFVNSIMN